MVQALHASVQWHRWTTHVASVSPSPSYMALDDTAFRPTMRGVQAGTQAVTTLVSRSAVVAERSHI